MIYVTGELIKTSLITLYAANMYNIHRTLQVAFLYENVLIALI